MTNSKINLFSNQQETNFLSSANYETKGEQIRFIADDFYKTKTKWFYMVQIGGGMGESFYTVKMKTGRVFFTLPTPAPVTPAKKKSGLDRSLVMTIANDLKKKGLSFSEALKAAYKAERTKRQMKVEVLEIKFLKADGTLRTATATLLPHLLPTPKFSSSKTRKKVSTKITFFDLDINQFRSFLPARLISTSVMELKETLTIDRTALSVAA